MDHPLHPPPEQCCSATARALDMFNRRGSVIAVVIGGNTNDVLPSTSQLPQPIVNDQPSTNSDPESQMNNSDAQEIIRRYEQKIAQRSACEWRPPYPRLVAYHDCLSLASAWSLGLHPPWLESRPTGASQAQSPTEEDTGDGKSNDLLSSCPAFRNELGVEPVRRIALSRATRDGPVDARDTETWHREHTAAEAHILEDVSNVYLGGRLCAARQPKCVIEPQDIGSYYFRHCFLGKTHYEYLGMDDELGPIAVSMVKDTAERKSETKETKGIFRLIIRISDIRTMRAAIPEEALSDSSPDRTTRSLMRELLEIMCPQLHFAILRPAIQTPKFEELLVKIDEQPIYTRYKVGVILCKHGQSSEEQMYNNEHSSPAFDEFLDFLGQRVRLKGFTQYKGGLDTRGDTTGAHSLYTEFEAHEIMFHVSTLLPYTPSNRQQLARKRHIGNDMVTIVFQEPGALPFSPITVRSHFQHVFIIVRVNNPCSETVSYSIAVSRSKDVPAFGPPIPRGACFSKCADFHDWLITKIINAENAVHRSKKFAVMAARTRREALRDLVENHVGPHQNEGPARIASRFLGGSVKRRERVISPKPNQLSATRGALSWLVDVHDHSVNQRISCVLGLSADALVLLERPSGSSIFITPTHSIIGWANTDMGLKLYYDHGDMLLLRCVSQDGTDIELNSLLQRLQSVSKGDEAREIVVRRPRTTDNWGFHVQDEGVVTDVEMYQTAWKAGLRQGSRIVEIESQTVATLSLDRMCEILNERETVRLLLISPAQDGSPRRGCEDPNCVAVKGQCDYMLTPDAFARQPITYGDMLRLRARDLDASPHSSPLSCDERQFSFVTKTLGSERARSKNSMTGITSPTGGSCSVHDNLCQLLNAPKPLNRAFSDEYLRLVRNSSLESEPSVAAEIERLRGEVVRCRMQMERMKQDNKALQTALEKERRSHDKTREEVKRLKSEQTTIL